MLHCFVAKTHDKVIPITPVIQADYVKWLSQQPERIKNWLVAANFQAKSSSFVLLSDADGHLQQVFLGMAHAQDTWAFGQLAIALAKGHYQIQSNLNSQQLYHAALAWGLGAYQFKVYRKMPLLEAKLVLPQGIDQDLLTNVVTSVYQVRDLINTPADDMGPAELAEAAEKLAGEFGAKFHQIVGEQLLVEGYPTIYTVGRASVHEPRLIDIRWGNLIHPKVTLVGKGVCFDTGGIDIKSREGSDLMKKDMAGGAHCLGLARMIMAANLPICLRVLIPAVENSVSGDAYHPRDIITTRKGITVEITNTDAEGRLVLCDALAEAVTEKLDILLDFATLTGAAKVALGPDLPALFSRDEQLIQSLLQLGKKENDPMWSLPIYLPYRDMLDSKIADISNASYSSYAGAITAAVFLNEFVPSDICWAHFDMMAWNTNNRPGRPEGGEAHAIRAVFAYLQEKYK